jgi:EAL domain-containing protein (putative c-di-GMP-specific phosphodiesterase class I)
MHQPMVTRVIDLPSELDRVLSQGLIAPAYQPIVELATGQVVAFEALARVAGDSPLARPDLLFATARDEGRLVELDWACRLAALRGAIAHGLRRPLFINCEPEAMPVPPAPEALAVIEEAKSLFQPVLELTERDLNDHPRAILETLPVIRDRGVGVALDDVGVDPRSLALMPFVLPDVIKLDLSLTQAPFDVDFAETVHAVNAHAERKGALVLAEGIETEEHVIRARSLGATHGQGWFFGRPGPLSAEARMPVSPMIVPGGEPCADDGAGTPFEAIAPQLHIRQGTKRLLLALSRQLEAHAAKLDHAGVLLSTFQSAEHFTGASRAQYERLGSELAFVGAIGRGLDHHENGGTRGAALEPGDPLELEWDVCVLGPHFAGAFVARDLGDTGPDMERRFAFAMTYDRELVVRVARRLMASLAPQPRR